MSRPGQCNVQYMPGQYGDPDIARPVNMLHYVADRMPGHCADPDTDRH
jgi:hypothetical protein